MLYKDGTMLIDSKECAAIVSATKGGSSPEPYAIVVHRRTRRVVATNGHVLLVALADAEGSDPPGDGSFAIPPDALSAARKIAGRSVIELSPGGVRVAGAHFTGSEHYRPMPQISDLLESAIRDVTDPRETHAVSIAPDYLRWIGSLPGTRTVQVRMGAALAPVVCTAIGDRVVWTAIVMPMRYDPYDLGVMIGKAVDP